MTQWSVYGGGGCAREGDGVVEELRRRGAAVTVALVDGRVVLTGATADGGRRVRVCGEAETLGAMARELSEALGVA